MKEEILSAQEITEIAEIMSRANISTKEAYRYVDLNDKLGRMHEQAAARENAAAEKLNEEPPSED